METSVLFLNIPVHADALTTTMEATTATTEMQTTTEATATDAITTEMPTQTPGQSVF